MRNSILISSKKDPDLVALYHKVGGYLFSGMVKDALRMLVRSNYKPKNRPPDGLLLQGNFEGKDVRFVLSVTAENDEDVRELLSHVKEKKLGLFVKQALRFYLGPVTILSGFFKEEYAKEIEQITVPVQVFSIGNSSNEENKKHKKQVTKRKSTSTATKRNSAPQTAPVPAQSVSSLPVPPFVISGNQNTSYEEELPTTQQNTGSEDDDMLAMLEGLL